MYLSIEVRFSALLLALFVDCFKGVSESVSLNYEICGGFVRASKRCWNGNVFGRNLIITNLQLRDKFLIK